MAQPAPSSVLPIRTGSSGVVIKDVRLRNAAEAAAHARREVVLCARHWGMAGDVAERLETCASEIVTNAYQHARGLPGSTVRLLLIRHPGWLRLEVHDRSDRLPRERRPAPTDPSGRGLTIIGYLAGRHGTDLTPTGKSVWAEFDVDSGGDVT
ncbi:ATP-binding protein [Actinomadura scrupuli]|uniref:ATP-binding protein n=1 Tax=Actinomadura scrupuli TaxID=559629 RepID=UPI003D993BC5